MSQTSGNGFFLCLKGNSILNTENRKIKFDELRDHAPLRPI